MCVISDARGIGLLLPDTAGVSVTKDTVTHSSWLVAESMFLTATRQPSFHRNRGTSFSLLDTVFQLYQNSEYAYICALFTYFLEVTHSLRCTLVAQWRIQMDSLGSAEHSFCRFACMRRRPRACARAQSKCSEPTLSKS